MVAPDRTLSVPLKFVAGITSGGTPKSDSANWDGDIPFITPPDLNGLDGAVVREWERSLTELGAAGSTRVSEAVLLSCRAPIGHIGVATREVTFNQGCKAIVPERPEDLTYLAHCLVAYRTALQAAGRGTTFTELSTTELSNFVVPWPSPSARRAIADYLDRETSEIDAMIAKLDELADTLLFRRTQMIERIFADWDCRPTPLFAVASSEDGRRVPLKAEDRAKIPGTIPYYGASGIIDNIDSFLWDNETRVLVSEDGANLVARRHPIAFIAEGRYWVNNHAHVLRPNDDADARLIPFAISITDIQHAITGSAQPKLTADALWRLKIPFPKNLSSSNALADHLDEVSGKIDAMLAKVAELKSLLIERRAALITDVVTGRKAVA